MSTKLDFTLLMRENNNKKKATFAKKMKYGSIELSEELKGKVLEPKEQLIKLPPMSNSQVSYLLDCFTSNVKTMYEKNKDVELYIPFNLEVQPIHSVFAALLDNKLDYDSYEKECKYYLKRIKHEKVLLNSIIEHFQNIELEKTSNKDVANKSFPQLMLWMQNFYNENFSVLDTNEKICRKKLREIKKVS